MADRHRHGYRIVQCCYCSARSTLAEDTGRLVCHGCGAPIRLIEGISPTPSRKPAHRTGPKPAVPHRAERPHEHLAKDRPSRRRKGKRKKRSFWSRVGDVFDDLGDLDDLLDLEDLFD